LPVVLDVAAMQELDVRAQMTAFCSADATDYMVLKVYGDLIIADACILKRPSPAPKRLDGKDCVKEVGLVTADGCNVQGLVVSVQASNA